MLQDNAELKGQVRAAEKQRADLEQDLAAANKAHGEEATRLRRIRKKTAEDLEEVQQQLKESRERLSTLELEHQQAVQELDAVTVQLHALQDKGVTADAAVSENTQLKQVRVLGVCMCLQCRYRSVELCADCGCVDGFSQTSCGA
jgi:seryl-tRNA synthetase